MQAECLVENVEKIIQHVGKVLSVNPSLSILSHIKISADKNNLVFSASDLELSIKIKIPAKIEKTGEAIVPGKQFIEIINSLPGDKLKLSVEKDILTLSVREHKITFQTLMSEEFPSLFKETGEKRHSFSEEELKDVFLKTAFCVSLDESRPILSGVLLSQKEKGLNIVATDGYRMSLKKIPRQIFKEEPKNITIPARLVNETLLFKREVDMLVSAKANLVFFNTEDILLSGRLLEGEYPDYERVIPAGFKTKITFNKEELIEILKLSSVFAKESASIIRLEIRNGVLVVRARSSGLGEGEFKQEVEQEGEGGEIVFNIKFVMDFLRNVSDETVVMEMNTAFEPGVFKLPSDPTFLHVIMPVRVQE